MFRHKINPPMLPSAFLIKINHIKDRSLHTLALVWLQRLPYLFLSSCWLIWNNPAKSICKTYSCVSLQRSTAFLQQTRWRTRMIHSPFDSCFLPLLWRNSEDTDRKHTNSRRTSVTNMQDRNREQSVWWEGCTQADGERQTHQNSCILFQRKLLLPLINFLNI